MRYLALLAVCILQIAIMDVRASGQYSVIAPGTLHSASKYNVAVALHQTTEPCEIKVGITGPSYNETKTVQLQANEVKNLQFDVPVIEKGDYNLTAEGVSGLIFQNTTKLNYAEFSPYVKIQTDKGIYKPGDLVNFRVLFLDENLKPATPQKDAIIFFEDGKRNRIKEIKNFEVTKGVYTGKFQISEFPVHGNWRLIVQNGERHNTPAFFEVSKYVLPKYNVKLEATENVAVQDGDMQVVVRSNYTYGKPFNGKVTLLINLEVYYNGEPDENRKTPPVLIKTANTVNGKAKFDLNVKEYEMYMPSKDSPSYMKITATVEENFTGVKINGTTTTVLYPYRYSMFCTSYSTCSTFHADKEDEVVFQVLHVDGTEVKDTKSPVKLTYTEGIRKNHWWQDDADSTTVAPPEEPKLENKTLVFESHLNATSMASFKVTLPSLEEFEGYSHFYNMKLEFAGEERSIYQTYQYKPPKIEEPTNEPEEPKEYFTAKIQYEPKKYSTKLHEDTTVTLNSSKPLPYFVYNIIGRGNVLHSERVELPNHPLVHNFTIKPTFLMSPYCKLYMFYVDGEGEFHYAETSFHVDVELQNEINITMPEQVKPGEDVPLRIKTAPNSFVGLLAVDQSVLQLRDNNDVNVHDFQWRLGSYDTRTPWQGGYSAYPGDLSGVVTLTNANFFYNRTAPTISFTADVQENVLYSAHRGGAVHKTSAVPQAAAGFGSPSGGGGSGNIAVRKDFAETWIFADIENTETEEFTWSKKIPDTITSWVLSGFSINSEKGLGVTKEKTNIKTFQPFFISIRLPYSVKRGEVINVPALVFNYLEKDLDVEVTLDNTDGEYEFTEVSNEVINEPQRKKTVRVPANSASGVSFMLRPKIIGNIMLKFTAISPIAGDAIHKTLKVVPEGVTEYANRAYFVNLKDTGEFAETFELALPAEVVPDSEHIEFAVVGDLLGPLLRNLDNLVRMPTGCGEQTVSTLVPNYLVLRYLKSINKLTPALEQKIKRNLEVGYQNILNYRHKDGSFSSFGPAKEDKKPRNGSTWLTAYVVRSLSQAGEYLDVDEKVLEQSLSYLASKQAENGSFVESGDYFYATQKNHITLTASVLLAFAENETLSKDYQTHIEKGFKYILENLDKTDDLHAKALATYTLHKTKHPEAAKQITDLTALAKTDEDRKWWSPTKQKITTPYWWRWSFSNEVEITSYIMLTLLDMESESVDSILPILKWLVAQRNSYGGFSSTQDTVVGLQALIKFVEKSNYEAAIMEVQLKSKDVKDSQETISVNDDNSILLQSVELPQKTHAIDFSAKGKGAALVQISYQYNILEKEKQPSFSIETVIDKNSPAFKLSMEVCVSYTGEGESSNMAVLEVSLPSGYVADESSFEHIEAVDRVRQTETKNSETVIVVYFESLLKDQSICLPIEAFKSFAVAMQKPAPVVLYDYYDTSKKATNYYEVASKLCDICEDDEKCEDACK